MVDLSIDPLKAELERIDRTSVRDRGAWLVFKIASWFTLIFVGSWFVAYEESALRFAGMWFAISGTTAAVADEARRRLDRRTRVILEALTKTSAV